MSRFRTVLEDVEIIQGVKKHGEHDQKTHGSWATGEGVGYKDSDNHPEFDFNEEHGTNLEYYTNVGSWEINGLLRTGKLPKDATFSKEEIRDIIKSMDTETLKHKLNKRKQMLKQQKHKQKQPKLQQHNKQQQC